MKSAQCDIITMDFLVAGYPQINRCGNCGPEGKLQYIVSNFLCLFLVLVQNHVGILSG